MSVLPDLDVRGSTGADTAGLAGRLSAGLTPLLKLLSGWARVGSRRRRAGGHGHTRESLELWRRQFDAAMLASGQASYDWDVRTNGLDYGGNYRELLGYTAEELAGGLGAWTALIHPEDLVAFNREAERVIAEHAPFDLEYRVRHKAGHYLLVRDGGHVFFDEDGNRSRVIGFITDVTERRRWEKALRASETFACSTVDALSAHIAILDADGVVLAVNRAWREFGQENGAPAGACDEGANYLRVCDWAAAAGVEEAARAGAGIRAVLAGDCEQFDMEYECHSPGEQRWFEMRVTRFAGGGPPRVVVAHENVTARRRAERMERERTALRDAVAAMERVLAVVGHELRTPLAGMRAIAELLLTDGASPGESRDFLKSIEEEVVRMSDTVNDLLEAARLNSGQARWNWSSFAPGEACRVALDSFRPLVDPQRVALELETEGDVGEMSGDADAVRRLVVNLVSNARKHTEAGSIRVRLRELRDSARRVEVRVSDTGCGMAPEVLAKLGQAFALNAGVVGAGLVGGTGLGLAICKGIVAAHGGGMSVESSPGVGTTITVRLRADLEGPVREGDKTFAGGAEPAVVAT